MKLTIVSQEREILALGVTAGNSRHHGTGRINLGLLAQKIIANIGVADPDVHLTADGGTEDTIVIITELLHGEPWAVGVDIMDASNIRDGGGRTGDELETWWRTISKHVFGDLDGTDDEEDGRTDEPLVGTNGGDGIGLEKSVGGLVVGTKIVLDLGHDDRRRYGRRHCENASATMDAAGGQELQTKGRENNMNVQREKGRGRKEGVKYNNIARGPGCLSRTRRRVCLGTSHGWPGEAGLSDRRSVMAQFHANAVRGRVPGAAQGAQPRPATLPGTEYTYG